MIILALIAFLVIINLFQLKLSSPGSDHFIHFGYLNSIKKNGNRFITSVDTFINKDDFPDPQLYHWLLSFIPRNTLSNYYKYCGLIFNIATLLFYIVFLLLFLPHLPPGVDHNLVILFSGLIFILTPFEYFTWNAKNIGLSARGFGLMLGHLFVYVITLYIFSESTIYFLLAIFISYIILLSSQFAFQFVLFFSIILAVIISKLVIVIIPFVSIIIFLITFPKWSRIFFVRQWAYKKMYYKILSARFGLKLRYSIWRDFVYDFWISIKSKGLIHGLEYIYRNPLIEVLIGFPAIFFVGLFYFINPDWDYSKSEQTLFLIIVSAGVIFLLTSFRSTRFLGEPQRYIEFVFPLISIFPIIVGGTWVLIWVLTLSAAIIIFELVGVKILARKEGGGSTNHEKTVEMMKVFKEIDKRDDEIMVASNNYDVMKYFASDTFKILNVNVTNEFTGGLHFNDIFPKHFGVFSLDSLIHLTNHYLVHWLILDEKLLSKAELMEHPENKFEPVTSIHQFTIYRRAENPR